MFVLSCRQKPEGVLIPGDKAVDFFLSLSGFLASNTSFMDKDFEWRWVGWEGPGLQCVKLERGAKDKMESQRVLNMNKHS